LQRGVGSAQFLEEPILFKYFSQGEMPISHRKHIPGKTKQDKTETKTNLRVIDI
jgi:hypothetical protein